jgi:FAD dependent oxidoreductase TIGR03364
MQHAGHFDLVVVGAGILGLATAWRARQRGWKVAVLERHARCIGASVRNFGFVTVTGQGPADHWRRAQISRAAWEDIAPQAGIPVLQRGAWVLAQRPEAAALLEAFVAGETGDGCRLLGPAQMQRECPALRAGELLLHSPHELRVESREAVARLAQWLEQVHGVDFHWHTAVHEIDLPHVHSSRGVFRAERCIVCPGHDLSNPHLQRLVDAGICPPIRICTLQMLRVAPSRPLSLPCTLMSDLSLLRYPGFSALPQAAALRRRLELEQPQHLAQGVHLIVAVAAEGSLVVGDSHVYGDAEQPFARSEVDQLILDELHNVLDGGDLQVTEHWVGSYASADQPVFLGSPAAGVAVGLVTSGTGASTAFALGDELLDCALGSHGGR